MSELETKRIQYLLGLCSQAERECIESEYFADKDAFQKMLTAEDDLIDAYARGELSGEERRQFEKRFLAAGGARKRVQFARALAGTLPVAPDRSERRFFKPRPLWITTATAAIVVIAVLAWLLLERGRLKNEVRELRAEVAELKQSATTDQTLTTEIAEQRNDRREQPVKPEQRESRTPNTKRVRPSPSPKVELVSEKIEMFQVQNTSELPINRSDATIPNTFETKKITQLPLESRNVANLLSLQTGITRDGTVAGARTDQSNITLDGVDINDPAKALTLIPVTLPYSVGGVALGSVPITIELTNSSDWIRPRLLLETHAKHTDYRLTIMTADGRPITSADWTQPITPNQNSIETPVIHVANLSAGDYQLTLEGKEPDGSFVQVAQYAFKIIRK